ncbi:hypothetical protein Dimus_038630 [Dionaea muscipula]
MFDNFCKLNGIERHKTVVNTPQQNGIAERMNRTLLEKVRCLLFTSKLPKYFWGEALNTAAYLINLSPSTALNFKCPYEIWNKRPPCLDHLKIFGCAAYMHKSDGKLNPRSTKCVFLGYQEGTKGYRLWDKGASGFKIMISRDVIFNENEFPCKADNNANDSFDDIVTADVSSSDQAENAMTPSIEVEHATSLEREGRTGTNQIEAADPATPQDEEGSSPTQMSHDEVSEQTTTDDPSENIESIHDYQLVRDRGKRVPKPNPRFSNFSYADLVFTALIAAADLNTEPASFFDAVNCKNSDLWKKAMDEEMDSLNKNKTWTLVPLPDKMKAIDCKWIYKLKEGISTSDPVRYKARLVAKGFSQREGIDYTEIFSPVVKYKTIRIMLAVCAFYDLELEQMDVKTAFLNGDLDETIYMKQPDGYVNEKHKNHVCKLNKSLYGLKQAPRQWYIKFDSFVTNIGFSEEQV